MIKYLIAFFLLFVLIISCASKDEKLQNYKDYVQKVSSQLKVEEGFSTIKVLGERRSIFSSYYLENQLVYINEDMSIGNRGSSANHYYFKDGRLIHYTQNTILMRDDSLNISTKTMINLGMYLDGKILLESEYWIGGTQKVITESDIERVITHSELLMELANKNRPRIKS